MCYRAGRGKIVGTGIFDFIRPSVFFLSCSKVSSIDVSVFVFVCLFAFKTIPEKLRVVVISCIAGADLYGS